MRSPGLTDIAEAMAERVWLDLRVVEMGVVGRALPLNITIWPDRDDVLVKQEFVVNGERGEKKLTIDAEDIMWMKPSVLALEDVIPPVMPDPPPDFKADAAALAGEIKEVIAAHLSISVKELVDGTRQPATSGRKFCIRLLWELTNIAQSDIPQFFGYHSGGMSCHALDWTAYKDNRDEVRELHRALERRVGHQLPGVERPSDRYVRSPRERLVSRELA